MGSSEAILIPFNPLSHPSKAVKCFRMKAILLIDSSKISPGGVIPFVSSVSYNVP